MTYFKFFHIRRATLTFIFSYELRCITQNECEYVAVKIYLPESFVHTALTADFILTCWPILGKTSWSFLKLLPSVEKSVGPNPTTRTNNYALATKPHLQTLIRLDIYCTSTVFSQKLNSCWYQNIHKCISCILFIFLQERTKFMRQYNVVAYVCWFQFFLGFPCVSSGWSHFAKVNLMVVCGIFTTWVS